MRDEIFKEPISKQFEFDDFVASVFDDMISRSVPFYDVSSNLNAKLLAKILPKSAKVCDLGCSTANSLLLLNNLRNDLVLSGVDNSEAMLANAKNKAKAYGADIEFILDNILECELEGFDAVLANYTLQFIRPPKRADLVQKIYNGLNENGVFLFSEKIIFEDKKLTKSVIEIYEDY